MPGQKKASKPKRTGWGICVTHPDGVCGWIIDEDLDVKTYPTQEEAEIAMEHMKKDKRYTWSLPMEAKRFQGLPMEE